MDSAQTAAGPLSPTEILVRIRQGWRALLAGAAAGVVLGLAYFALAPRWYRSAISLMPVQSQRGGLPVQMAGALASLDLPIDPAAADVDRVAAVLESDSVSDAVIDKFTLFERYGEKYRENVLKELWRHCDTKMDKKARLVSLTCEDKDPVTAKAMVDTFAEVGNRVFRRVSASSASEEVKFLEQRVAETLKQADEASQRLREFQEAHKVVDLEEQSRAVVLAMATLKTQEISKQLELSYMTGFSAHDEATASQLRRQIAIMDRKLRSLEEEEEGAAVARDALLGEAGTPPKRARPEIFPPALSVPKLRFDLERLIREQKIRQTLYTMLVQRLETAKVNEARDTSTFQILDRPRVADRKTRPKGAQVLGLGLVLGLLAAVTWVLWPLARQVLRDAALAGGPAAVS